MLGRLTQTGKKLGRGLQELESKVDQKIATKLGERGWNIVRGEDDEGSGGAAGPNPPRGVGGPPRGEEESGHEGGGVRWLQHMGSKAARVAGDGGAGVVRVVNRLGTASADDVASPPPVPDEGLGGAAQRLSSAPGEAADEGGESPSSSAWNKLRFDVNAGTLVRGLGHAVYDKVGGHHHHSEADEQRDSDRDDSTDGEVGHAASSGGDNNDDDERPRMMTKQEAEAAARADEEAWRRRRAQRARPSQPRGRWKGARRALKRQPGERSGGSASSSGLSEEDDDDDGAHESEEDTGLLSGVSALGRSAIEKGKKAGKAAGQRVGVVEKEPETLMDQVTAELPSLKRKTRVKAFGLCCTVGCCLMTLSIAFVPTIMVAPANFARYVSGFFASATSRLASSSVDCLFFSR
jgi:hypothetical protein